MNRAERRRAAAIARKAKQRWARGIRRFHEQALGAFTVELLRPESILTDPDRVVPLLVNWQWQARACHDGPLCMTCDVVLRPSDVPQALLVATGAMEGPHHRGIVSGICRSCAGRSDADLVSAGLALLRQVWPDLREVPTASVHTDGGRV